MSLSSNIKMKFALYWLVSFCLLLFWEIAINHTKADLIEELTTPAYSWGTIFKWWQDKQSVWKNVIEDGITASISMKWLRFGDNSSIIVRVIKILLILTITLSVTMILYNWMKYIIEVWNGKDGKSLIKNVAYIVIWILIALFSTTIITILQSIPTSISEEMGNWWKGVDDKAIWEREGMSYSEYFE